MYKLGKTPELSAVEVVLIENIFLILNRLEKLNKTIIENIEDYNKVIEAAREMKHYNIYDGPIVLLKEQFFQYASLDTLRKIANEEKFKPEYGWQEPFTIPKAVLKEFKYSGEIKADDPKAQIAKKLGAKLIM